MDQAEEYVKRMLKVLIYIEENIDEDLNMEGLAKIACYSPFHFHRVFHAIVGETVHQYVKRLRIQRASGRLRYSKKPITEIALDSSYDTPSAFTKAFKQFMGMTPKNYRALFTAVNIMTKQIKELPMIKPDKIDKNLPDLNLLFARGYGSYTTQSPEIAWQKIKSFVKQNNLDLSKLRCFGISHDNPDVTSEDKLRYDAAILAPQGIKEEGEIGRQVLKGGKYAIFTLHGYRELDEKIDNIFLKWLPDSQETFDETRTVFSEYFNMEWFETEPEKLITKLHIPLK